ncbi:MAG: hypothetical protein IH830_00285 [Planctomycetes bacterium]|nr:hypothetical protein [Planctomycetota bacterium]
MRLGKTTTGFVAVALLAWWGGHRALGGVIEFTDPLEWQAAVGPFTTIDFTGFPDGTPITDQYADLGVLFVGGNEHIFLSENAFPNDGAGLNSAFADIVTQFDTPQLWIAVDFPGLIQFELFSGGELIYTSSVFDDILGPFAGLLSTEPFDMVALDGPAGLTVNIDDLFFGVPGPGGLPLLALGSLFSTRRRRSGLTAAASTED